MARQQAQLGELWNTYQSRRHVGTAMKEVRFVFPCAAARLSRHMNYGYGIGVRTVTPFAEFGISTDVEGSSMLLKSLFVLERRNLRCTKH